MTLKEKISNLIHDINNLDEIIKDRQSKNINFSMVSAHKDALVNKVLELSRIDPTFNLFDTLNELNDGTYDIHTVTDNSDDWYEKIHVLKKDDLATIIEINEEIKGTIHIERCPNDDIVVVYKGRVPTGSRIFKVELNRNL